MRLIAGLGNPGVRYAGTRHNMGFAALDRLAGLWGVSLSRRGYAGVYGQGTVDETRVTLLKPHTFMNDSGRSIAEAVRYLGVEPAGLLVLYDDIDLPPGAVRVRAGGGAGTHNGMRSVLEWLGTEEFPRIRMGVGAPPVREQLIDWVLGRPGETDRPLLRDAAERAAQAADAWLRRGIDAAMREYNG